MHVVSRAGGTFYLEGVAIEHVEAQQRLDKQEVNAQPDGPAPVTVAAEESTVRVAGDIVDSEFLTVDSHGVWVLLVVLGHGSDTVFGEELGLVQHPLEDLLETISANQRQKQSLVLATTLHTGNVSLCHILSILNKPIQPSLERRELLDQFWLKRENSIQRNQADERPHGELLGPRLAVRDSVIVEPTDVRFQINDKVKRSRTRLPHSTVRSLVLPT